MTCIGTKVYKYVMRMNQGLNVWCVYEPWSMIMVMVCIRTKVYKDGMCMNQCL